MITRPGWPRLALSDIASAPAMDYALHMKAPQVNRRRRRAIALAFACLAAISWARQPSAGQGLPPPGPLIRENATVKLADHVWAIPDFKRAGKSNDEAVAAVVADIAPKYPEWGSPSGAAAVARAAYAEAR